MIALPPAPTIDASTCGVGSTGADGCRACVDRCPYGAIDVRGRPEGAEIRIDSQLCQRCGACSGVCPTTSIERSFLPDGELIAAVTAAVAAAPAPVIALTCPWSAGKVAAAVGADHVVVTPSLLIVNETHLVAAVARGARGVVLVGCLRCTHDQPQLLIEPLAVTRTMLAEPRRVAYVEDDRTDRLAAAIVTIAELPPPPPPLDRDGAAVLTAAATRRERLRILLPLVDGAAATPLSARGFGTVEVDDTACVACGACAVTCPTDALVLDPTVATLSITDVDCIGCGACASVCPDRAITVEAVVPTGPGALVPRILVADDPVSCRDCGVHYAPQRLLQHARDVLLAAGLDPDDPRLQLGVCPTCRDVHARREPIDELRDPKGESCACGSEGGCGGSANGSGPCGDACGCDSAGDGVLAGAGTSTTRRTFLKGAVATAAVGAALPLFRGSTPAIAAEEAPVIVPGRMGMVIDLDRCIGCHACTNVCKAENNVPLGKFRDWVEEHVLGEYPNARPVFLPKLCNHCDDPGCLRACPTGAIRKRPDGIVDLDPDICIACQACMQGCPYGMTFYNHQRGTADKCNLCVHRIDQGLDPACVDICPSQCRIVGDFDDPDSPVSQYLAERDATVLREDLGLGPNIRYVGFPGELNR